MIEQRRTIYLRPSRLDGFFLEVAFPLATFLGWRRAHQLVRFGRRLIDGRSTTV